jgi:hypothetical protein
MQSCSVADSGSLLSQVGILQRVLSYVGPGHWWFVSTVCSLWRDFYQQLASVQMVGYDEFEHKVNITCTPQTTLCSAVFASGSRVRLALKALSCTQEHCQVLAGRYANAEALVAARELGMSFTLATMCGCAFCNKLAVMQFLRAQRCAWDGYVCETAAERGFFEMLRWAREHGCPWFDNDILEAAASSGNIEMVAWVKQRPDVICSSREILRAAANGHIAMCAYLRSEAVPWHDLACYAAAAGAHADTLHWLQEHGCPCDAPSTELCYRAARGGGVDVLSYLQAEGFLDNVQLLSYLLKVAGAHNKLAAAQWLRQQGADWPAVLLDYNTKWFGDVLAWARAEGCTSPTQ